MRIYESDGSYTDQPDDVEFGWFIFQDRPEEEPTVGESLQDSVMIEEVKKPPPRNVRIINPKIKMQPVKSVVLVDPAEGRRQETPESIGLGNIDSKVPSKQQVSNLITPWSAESKLLLSVVHYAKYEKVMGEEINWDKKSSNCPSFRFYLNNDTNSTLNDEITDYNETKEANMMSLMMELILVDMKCDVTDVVKQPVDTSDLGNSIQSDNSSGQEVDKAIEKPMQISEAASRSEILHSIGLSDVIDKSIEKMCAETEDIHLQIAEIRQSFHTDEAKVNALILEARQLEKNLRETRYLDELIHLLNGDLHKVAPKKWPFKLFLHPSDKNDINLIV